jgi:hypothetical protein
LDYPTAVSTLSASGFASGAILTVFEIVGGEPSTKGLKTCFQPTGSTTNKVLKPCKKGNKLRAPCQKSLIEASGSVIAILVVPATDPRFWVGGNPVDLTSFSPTKGGPGANFTLKGKNLSQVTAVVIGGAQATIDSQNTSDELVTVPQRTSTGYITVTTDSGLTTSAKAFTVLGTG